ncbi:MAG: hypothetical protein ACE5Q6_19015, partial [Dehalococcoidia bacterium]
MENQEQTPKNPMRRTVTRRTALKAGGVAAVGLAFSKPLIETVYPQPAFAQLSSAGLTNPTSTPEWEPEQQDYVGCNPNAWTFDLQWGLGINRWGIINGARCVEVEKQSGRVWVGLASAYSVHKFDANGNLLVEHDYRNGSGPAQFEEDHHVQDMYIYTHPLYGDERILAADTGNHRIQELDLDFNWMHYINSGEQYPYGVTRDARSYQDS